MLLAALTEPLIGLRGVGPAAVRAMARLGVTTVGELLEHFPRDHEDRSRVTPLELAAPGRPLVVQATVAAHRWFGPGGRHLRVELAAERSGEPPRAALLCFGRRFLARSLPVGARVTVAASFERRGGRLEAAAFELRRGADAAGFGRIIPIYPLTEGVRPAMLRRMMLAACGRLGGLDTPWDAGCRRRCLLPVAAAVRALHFPDDAAALRRARTSLAYAELLRLQTALYRRRPPRRLPRRAAGALPGRVAGGLRFALTGDQEAVLREIVAGLRAPRPSARLLQGEVGCGKTLVALLAAAWVIEAQEQVALIVPTELLARQHARTAAAILGPCGIKVTLLTGGALPGAGRQTLLAALRRREVDLVVGTQALLQEDVAFAALGLVIVDEQHRFGVAQRRRLRERNPAADLLLMTATPIPRSLALTVYGDLELSVIRQLPPGRCAVRTYLARSDRLGEVFARVRGELAGGGQAYFVAPRIGAPAVGAGADGAPEHPEPASAVASGAALDAVPDALSLHASLSAEVYPEFRVGLIHGALPEQRKHAAMEAFRNGELAVLVATTVVEVGVDVAAATGMVVLGAERFGLATLHQLRGRVGRGARPGYAFLVYTPPLAAAGVERLRALKETGDGFELAERDLAQRGPGELLGLRQAGLPELRIAELGRDLELARQARRDARGALAGEGAAPAADCPG